MAITVTGKVKDENGADFPGVNVLVKGTAVGTSTDINGSYSLEVPDESAILVFSFIGYAYAGSNCWLENRYRSYTRVQTLSLWKKLWLRHWVLKDPSKSLGYSTAKVIQRN